MNKPTKIIGGVVGGIVLIGIGSTMTGGSDTDTAVGSNATATASASTQATPTAATSTAPAKPKGNVVGNWKILTKHPKFGQEYGMFKAVKLDVKNVSDSPDEPWLEIRLTKGNRLVTTFDCVGQTVRPGEVTTLSCSSMDDYAPWSKYEIKNAF